MENNPDSCVVTLPPGTQQQLLSSKSWVMFYKKSFLVIPKFSPESHTSDGNKADMAVSDFDVCT